MHCITAAPAPAPALPVPAHLDSPQAFGGAGQQAAGVGVVLSHQQLHNTVDLRLCEAAQRGGPGRVRALPRAGQRLQRLGPHELLQALRTAGRSGAGKAGSSGEGGGKGRLAAAVAAPAAGSCGEGGPWRC